MRIAASLLAASKRASARGEQSLIRREYEVSSTFRRNSTSGQFLARKSLLAQLDLVFWAGIFHFSACRIEAR